MTLSTLLAAFLVAGGEPSDAALPVHVGGRVIHGEDGALAFGWPGTYFEGRFRGTGVEVAAESRTEFMRVLVDGEEKAQLRRPGKVRVVLQGLAPGEHVVRLEKMTESQTGGGRFIGFYAVAGSQPLAAVPRRRQIEFIGDSYTVGYGNTSPGRTCTEREVHDRTDTQQAFGPLLARRLGADYRIHAYSGFGVVRNYNGGRPGESLPLIYPRLVPDKAAPEADSGAWRPQLIVANLGTNDFSTPLKAGEPWRSDAELRRAYRERYVAFVGSLIAKQPQARLILMGSDNFIGEVKQVAAELAKRGGRQVTTLRFGELENTGCHFHPSLKDHEELAALVEGAIKAGETGK